VQLQTLIVTRVCLVLQVLLTFGAALAIETDLSKNVNPVVLGASLVCVNVLVLGLALGLGAWRHVREEREQWGWQKLLNTQEFALVQAVMNGDPAASSALSSQALRQRGSHREGRTASTGASVDGGAGALAQGIEMGSGSLSSRPPDGGEGGSGNGGSKAPKRRRRSQEEADSASAAVLQQYLVKAKDVKLAKKVGAGSFGEVFRGTYLGRQPVAVKTMLHVTEASARTFRKEILLTATLHHPNIVSARKKLFV
jgi:hypothetical protein